MMVIRAGGTAPPSDLERQLSQAVRAYEVAVRGVARLPRRPSDAAKAQFMQDMGRLMQLRDRVVALRRG